MAAVTICSAYKINKQDDNIQPCHTPFWILNPYFVPCPSLTVASWPAYRFLRRQVRWSGMVSHLFKNFPQFAMIHTVSGFPLIYLHCSFNKSSLSLHAILWNSAFSWVYLSLSHLPFDSLLCSVVCKTSSDNHFAFLHSSFGGIILVTAYCTMLWTPVHSPSGTLSTTSNHLNLFITSSV